MGKNIILFGLQFDNNLGDQAIVQSTAYIINGILEELGMKEFEIREVDMTGRTAPEDNPYRKKVLSGYRFRIIRKLYNALKIRDKDKKLKVIEIKNICRKLCRKNIDSGTDAIIFAGGGLIKYEHQFLQEYLYYIIKYADKRRIPVMLSAVGVEGYDENNSDCRKLKKAINYDCVKMITTRDDIELLQNSYVLHPIVTAQVADPVCSIDKLFPGKNNPVKGKKVIGLNCVRAQLFAEYGVNFRKEQMLELWRRLFDKITQAGYICKLFCNGARSDEQFCFELLEYMNVPNVNRSSVLEARPETAEELVHTITSFDAVISCRLHAGIIAYAYGIPEIGLVWNNKQRFFGEAIGYSERFISADNFNVEYIMEQLEMAIENGYNRVDREKFCDTTKMYLKEFLFEHL